MHSGPDANAIDSGKSLRSRFAEAMAPRAARASSCAIAVMTGSSLSIVASDGFPAWKVASGWSALPLPCALPLPGLLVFSSVRSNRVKCQVMHCGEFTE